MSIASASWDATVVGLDEMDGGWKLVMEYPDGVGLDAVLNRGNRTNNRLPLGLVCRLGLDVLGTLRFTHELVDSEGQPLNIIHRDIAPSSVFVTRNGSAMLLNSRMARGASRLIHTAVGSARGNAGYMAPEQWRGGDLDQRVDIWGVGVLLWEALTAERFIPTEDPQTAAAITLHGNLPRVETLVPDLPPALAAIVSRALQRDPDLRFQSAASFHRELREFVDLYRVDIDRDRGAHFLAEHHADQMDREVPLQGPVNASGDCIPSPPPGRTAAAAKPLAPSRRPPLSLPEACVLCSPKPLWRSWMGPVLALCAFVLGMWLGACHLGPVVVGHRVTSEAASTIDSPRSRHLWLAQPLVVDQGGTQGGGPGGG